MIARDARDSQTVLVIIICAGTLYDLVRAVLAAFGIYWTPSLHNLFGWLL